MGVRVRVFPALLACLVLILPADTTTAGASGLCDDADGRGYLAPVQDHVECFALFDGFRFVRCTPLADELLFVGEVSCEVDFIEVISCSYVPLAEPECRGRGLVQNADGALIDCFAGGVGLWGCEVTVL